MFTITITASPELLDLGNRLVAALTGNKPVQSAPVNNLTAVPATNTAVEETPVQEDAPIPKKRCTTTAPVETKTEEVKAEQPADTKSVTLTIQHVRAAANPIREAGHGQKIAALLKEFEVESLSGLKEDQYAPFIAKLETLKTA